MDDGIVAMGVIDVRAILRICQRTMYAYRVLSTTFQLKYSDAGYVLQSARKRNI